MNCANRTKLRNAIHSKFHVIFNRRREINKVLRFLENICKGVIFHFSFCNVLIFAKLDNFTNVLGNFSKFLLKVKVTYQIL